MNQVKMIIYFKLLEYQNTFFSFPEKAKNLSISQAHAEGWSTIAFAQITSY